ncbi:hypothetical protein GJ496_001916, partial [Pomphorhynchus laevis]
KALLNCLLIQGALVCLARMHLTATHFLHRQHIDSCQFILPRILFK